MDRANPQHLHNGKKHNVVLNFNPSTRYKIYYLQNLCKYTVTFTRIHSFRHCHVLQGSRGSKDSRRPRGGGAGERGGGRDKGRGPGQGGGKLGELEEWVEVEMRGGGNGARGQGGAN